MNYRRSRRLLELSLVTGGTMAAAGIRKNNALLGCFGSAILLAGAVQAWAFCRCPRCGAKLEWIQKERNPDRCPKCGENLKTEK